MKFLDVEKHTAELNEHIKSLNSYSDFFEAVEARLTLAVNTEDAFKGEGATGVNNYHEHMALPSIRSLRTVIDSFAEKLEKMIALITEFEPESNGSVSSEFWATNLPNSYNNYEEAVQESEQNINRTLDSVRHILDLGKLEAEDVYTNVQNARDHADKVLEGLNELDQKGVDLMALVRTEMAELKATIKQVIGWTMSGGVTMNGVNIMEVGGYFAKATLHKQAPPVDTSKVKAGVTEPELEDNPALVDVRFTHPGLDPLSYYTSPTMPAGSSDVLNRMNHRSPLSARLNRQRLRGPVGSVVGSGFGFRGASVVGRASSFDDNDKDIDVSNASSAYEAAHLVKQANGEGKTRTKYFSDDWGAPLPETDWNWSREDFATIIDFTPVLGNIKSGYEAIFGVDPITGRKLAPWERALAGAGVAGGPVTKAISKGAKAAKGADNVGDVANAGKGVPKFVNGFEATVHTGKQGKHIPGHPNYQQGKSIFTGDSPKLLDKYAGKGEWIGQNKERVDFGEAIGKYVDPVTGNTYETTKGIIHYSKKGAHIVPARP